MTAVWYLGSYFLFLRGNTTPPHTITPTHSSKMRWFDMDELSWDTRLGSSPRYEQLALFSHSHLLGPDRTKLDQGHGRVQSEGKMSKSHTETFKVKCLMNECNHSSHTDIPTHLPEGTFFYMSFSLQWNLRMLCWLQSYSRHKVKSVDDLGNL